MHNQEYHDNQGCIGKALREETFFIDNLPNPETNLDEYIESSKKYNLSEDTIKKLSMKSRTYYAKRILDFNDVRKCVVLIEDIKEKAFEREVIETILQKKIIILRFLIKEHDKYNIKPHLHFARQKGY